MGESRQAVNSIGEGLMSKGEKLNGSVDILAKAMKQVFQEATAQAVEPVMEEMTAMEKRLDKKIDSAVETTNGNMQAQFAKQEEKVAKQGKKIDRLLARG